MCVCVSGCRCVFGLLALLCFAVIRAAEIYQHCTLSVCACVHLCVCVCVSAYMHIYRCISYIYVYVGIL